MFKFNPKFKRESTLDYPYIVEEVLQFIIFSREENLSTDSIVDLIFEYCRQTGLSEEFVGDAIFQNVVFKQLIEDDMSMRSSKNGDW